MKKIIVRKLPTYSLPLVHEVHNGGRILQPAGELAQIANGNFFRFLVYIEFLPDAPTRRGNHFHGAKEEYLYILKGRLKAVYQDIDTDETEEMVLEAGDLVNVKPRCAHVYFPLEYSQSIEFSESPFDPADTIAYEMHHNTAGRDKAPNL